MRTKIEQEIKKHILPKLFRTIKFTPEKKIFMSGEDNLILSTRRGNKNIILRVTPESYRTYNETCSELDIIEYLVSQGVPAAKPLFLIDDAKTLRFNCKENWYTVSVFEKAKGRKISEDNRAKCI
jgi:Ser/Thr protein kinase RdoA (MazF antagonist)